MEWVLVTGAAKGLGAAIVDALAGQGKQVLIHFRSGIQEAESLAARCREKYGVKAETIQGDFSTAQSTENFIQILTQNYGNISGLVNNVGTYLAKPALGTSSSEISDLFQICFLSAFEIIKALLPSIIAHKGSILNIGMAGMNSQRTETHAFGYIIAKRSLWELTKSLAKELGTDQVSVNMLSPGYLENSLERPKKRETIPMERLGKLEEAARLAAFLLDKDNRYITGQNIEIAGGVRL